MIDLKRCWRKEAGEEAMDFFGGARARAMMPRSWK